MILSYGEIDEANKKLEKYCDKHLHLYCSITDSGDLHIDGRFSRSEWLELVHLLTEIGVVKL